MVVILPCAPINRSDRIQTDSGKFERYLCVVKTLVVECFRVTIISLEFTAKSQHDSGSRLARP
eukprot:16437198-Heterocapsa_arctica.AAC.1